MLCSLRSRVSTCSSTPSRPATATAGIFTIARFGAFATRSKRHSTPASHTDAVWGARRADMRPPGAVIGGSLSAACGGRQADVFRSGAAPAAGLATLERRSPVAFHKSFQLPRASPDPPAAARIERTATACATDAGTSRRRCRPVIRPAGPRHRARPAAPGTPAARFAARFPRPFAPGAWPPPAACPGAGRPSSRAAVLRGVGARACHGPAPA